jgi:hypothetical protein
MSHVSLASLHAIMAMKMLAYRVFDDLVDEYIRMRVHFPLVNVHVLQSSGSSVCRRILERTNCCRHCSVLSINESRGFSGMLKSIVCINWEWKNCPFAWQGRYKVHVEGCTIILEAVAWQDI